MYLDQKKKIKKNRKKAMMANALHAPAFSGVFQDQGMAFIHCAAAIQADLVLRVQFLDMAAVGCIGRSLPAIVATAADGSAACSLPLMPRLYISGLFLQKRARSPEAQWLSRARRKPRMFSLLSGFSLLRLAERISSALLAQEPPRTARSSPLSGPLRDSYRGRFS